MIPYTRKLSSGKTFAVGTQNDHSRENFRGPSGRGQYVLYTASDSRGKLSRSTEKTTKVFPLESFPVYSTSIPKSIPFTLFLNTTISIIVFPRADQRV